MSPRPRNDNNDKNVYIRQLQDLYIKLNRTPKRREFSNATHFCKVFGSWNEALLAAGLPLLREVSPPKEKLIKSLVDFYQNNKRSPWATECRKNNGLFDYDTYLKGLNVDSWGKVLDVSGLPIHFETFKANGLSDVEILKKVRRCILKHGITSASEYNKKRGDLPSSTALIDHYGSWTNVLKKACLNLNMSKYNKDMFVERFQVFVSSKGYVPSLNEFAEHLGVPCRAITIYLGTYNEFIQSQGFTPQFESPENVIEDIEQLKKIYMEFSIKHGYHTGASAKALDESSEIYNSDVFVIRFGSLNELRNACGFAALSKGKKKYSLEEIKSMLIKEYELLGRKPTQEEIKNSERLPSLTTILRYFKTTAIEKVWEMVLANDCQ